MLLQAYSHTIIVLPIEKQLQRKKKKKNTLSNGYIYIYRTTGAFLMLNIFFSFCRTDPFTPNLPLLASQHQNTTTHTEKLKMNHAPIAANHMTETMLLFRHH